MAIKTKKSKKILIKKKSISNKKITAKQKSKMRTTKKSAPIKKIKLKIKPAKKISKSKAMGKKPVISKKPKISEMTKIPITKLHRASAGPLGFTPYKVKKDEPYMNAEQLRHFEAILNLWKKQLMQEVDRTIYDLKDVNTYSDPIDRASQEEEFNLMLRERDRERKLLKKIDDALARIKNGDYGYCDECGAEIGIRRLEARPTATQCIECKTVAEIREKQIGS